MFRTLLGASVSWLVSVGGLSFAFMKTTTSEHAANSGKVNVCVIPVSVSNRAFHWQNVKAKLL